MRLILLIVVACAAFGMLSGCRASDRRKVEAKLWLVDSEDQTLYRIVKKPDGSEVEQYYNIQSNPDKMKEFACMLASDRKQIYDAWTRCGCYL